MEPDTARMFIALWPDPAVRESLRQWRDAWDWPRSAAPVGTDKLHVTLHFLGSVPREQVPELVAGLGVPFAPFALEFGQPEIWHGSIAVLEPTAAPEPLLALHGALGEALERLGLVLEPRQYRPHVTMARRAGGALKPAQGPQIRWQVDGYALMESEGGGGAYQMVRPYPATP